MKMSSIDGTEERVDRQVRQRDREKQISSVKLIMKMSMTRLGDPIFIVRHWSGD